VSQFPQPEAFTASVSFTKRFRIQYPTGGPTTVIFSNVDLAKLLSVCLDVTTAVSLVDRFRINRVEVFGPMSSALTPVTVKLEFLGSTQSFSGNTKLYSDTSMSSVSAAYLNVRPDPNSASGMWTTTSASVSQDMFAVTYVPGSIIDIVLEVTLNDGVVGNLPFVVSGQTAGKIGTKCPTGASSLGLPNL
jgi:hypothetical protein